MADISRATSFGKLNPILYKAIEGATVFAKLRGNPYVELVHWINQLLQLQDSDLHRILRHFNVEPAALAKDITESLDRLPRGATSLSDLSDHIDSAVERGWVKASPKRTSTASRDATHLPKTCLCRPQAMATRPQISRVASWFGCPRLA